MCVRWSACRRGRQRCSPDGLVLVRQVMFCRSVLLLATTFSFVCVCRPSMADEPGGGGSNGDAKPAEKLTENWSRVIPVADPADARYGQWRVWVQDGWLLVERRTGKDEIEWKIVLAKVVGDEPPEIVAERLSAGASVDRRDPRTGAAVAPGAIRPVP